jgi:hypothetical protein
MTRFDLIASGLKSLAHNPDHPESKVQPEPWKWMLDTVNIISDDRMIFMTKRAYDSFLRPSRKAICVPTPLWYS